MPSRSREMTAKVVAKWIAEGRGQGEGSDYKPWLTIHDVPSKGLSTRFNGWKTDRVYQLLSQLELAYFYTLEWSPFVIDIREQYPLLPQDATMKIAEKLNITYPVYPGPDKEPVVLTSDFLITVIREGEQKMVARTVKYSRDLSSARVIAKFQIEADFLRDRKIDWGIVTERDIPQGLAANMKRFHGYRDLTGRLDLTATEVNDVAGVLAGEIQSTDLPLRKITAACDQRLGYDPGTALVVVWHMLANRYWEIDMYRPIEPGQKLVLLAVNEKPS